MIGRVYHNAVKLLFGLRVREKYDDGRLATNGPAVKASPNVTRARSEGQLRLSGPKMADKPVIEIPLTDDDRWPWLARAPLRCHVPSGPRNRSRMPLKRRAGAPAAPAAP